MPENEGPKVRKKLIEVALPLEAINKAAAKEKSIRHGHPSTLHLWWARRPLAAARAVIFSQMVDDPSAYLTDEKEVGRERDRLFALIEEMVVWKNTTNEPLLERARAEIRRSWARECLGNGPVTALSDGQIKAKLAAGKIEPLPGFHDPFAGGGALPLEAQRLGLESYASDLNPVAVLINKAMIEIPPKFAGTPPVNPKSRNGELGTRPWRGAQGLAEDVRYYGQWVRDEAEKRIGHLYPPVTVTEEMAEGRDDLTPYVGRDLTVVAWIWARTVRSPNPAFRDVDVPLISTYLLSTKKGKETWLQPVIEGSKYRFEVRRGLPPAEAKSGTKFVNELGKPVKATLRCLLSGATMKGKYIDSEMCAGRGGRTVLAVVCQGNRGRVYLPVDEGLQSQIESSTRPYFEDAQFTDSLPRQECRGTFASNAQGRRYGFFEFKDYFTPRQLVALGTLSDLVDEARKQVLESCHASLSPLSRGKHAEREGLTTRADAYADAVATYLSFAVSKTADYNSSIVLWSPTRDQAKSTFARQALPMTWDYAEVNPLAGAAGDFQVSLGGAVRFLSAALADGQGSAVQEDSAKQCVSSRKVVSTDPPYYDNVCYSDLSDFFYVWLRRTLQPIFPGLFATLTVPKAEELIATPYRHASKQAAEVFFMDGMTRAIHNLAEQANPAFPVTIYYAFKQSESGKDGTASTGWETFLEAVQVAGFAVVGTWPMRTERGARMIGMGTNALASSIVLVCRKRPESAGMTTRRDFQAQLRRELPRALRDLQHGNIAPVDLAQSAIGPGMAIYSRYRKVVEADGSPMKIRMALALINEALDEVLAEQEGELDADSRWAVAWYSEYGTGEGPFGRADDLSRAKNTSVDGLTQAGIIHAKSGQVNLLCREEMDPDWNPTTDQRLTVWEATQYLIRTLENDGETEAAELLARLGGVADQARDLSYRLYVLCERKGWAEEARSYNGLVIAWPELLRLSNQAELPADLRQPGLF
jgi:putative DNA methylase